MADSSLEELKLILFKQQLYEKEIENLKRQIDENEKKIYEKLEKEIKERHDDSRTRDDREKGYLWKGVITLGIIVSGLVTVIYNLFLRGNINGN